MAALSFQCAARLPVDGCLRSTTDPSLQVLQCGSGVVNKPPPDTRYSTGVPASLHGLVAEFSAWLSVHVHSKLEPNPA